MEGAQIALVAIYLLSPRVDDLIPLSEMQAAGFQPPATTLVLNEGWVDTSREPTREFATPRHYPAYRAAIERGAVEI